MSVPYTYAQSNSVLASGEWFKIAVSKEGVYKIDYKFLQQLGIDPSVVNPRNIKIYGNGGRMLPQANSANRPTDLIENAVWVEATNDNKFDEGEYVLFYGQSPHRIDTYGYSTNIFENKSYYFLTFNDRPSKRIWTTENEGLDFPIVNTYDYLEVIQEEKTNILSSGREWYGDRFDVNNERTYTFNVPDAKIGGKLKITSAVMAQSYAESSFDVFVNGTKIGSQSIDGVTNYTYGQKGWDNVATFSSTTPSDKIDVRLVYNLNNSGRSVGYLNYLITHVERSLVQTAESMNFRNSESIKQPLSTFIVSNASSNSVIWDVTNAYEPKVQEAELIGNELKFGAVTLGNPEYVIFNKLTVANPQFVKKIANQNIRSISSADLLIVSHPVFLSEAERLAEFRRTHDGLDVKVVTTDQVYNEFSSGSVDFTAIRDFARHVYIQGGLKHLLLFGKGTYDLKDVFNKQLNIVPTYESRNSLHPLLTYSSDDYFGLLEDDEGEWIETNAGDETLDIGVGRLPVKTIDEAKGVVDKLIAYGSNRYLGKWKNKLVFVADDGDFNIHQSQAHYLANFVDTAFASFDTKRFFLDNFKQEAEPSGEKSKAAKKGINDFIDQGALIVNYTGHGGESGWTQEAILDVEMIDEWTNLNVMPLFVTATCEFGRHDDPKRDSGGEKTILNKNGGAIAIVTTTRPVNSSTNFSLNKAFYNVIFSKENGMYLTLGDIFKYTKNNSLSGSANRNFSLLGDPSMRLAYPEYDIRIENINDNNVLNGLDTLKALAITSISGKVYFNNQVQSNFNGKAFITVYDKILEQKTLGNENAPFSYKEWSNVIYNGQASVIDGNFEASFVIPKNIDYKIGKGRIGLYAIDESTKSDAHGAEIEVIIGESDFNSVDNTAPSIELFINDTTFVNYGVTGENILLLAHLFDENGINTSSKYVTNNITASVDEDEAININEYYLSDLDTYKSGWVAYPLNGLSPGKHTITLSVSDTYNNVSERIIHFVVSNQGDFVIQELGNYPNPVKDHTNFFVTHSRGGDDLVVSFTIMKVSGEVVASLEKQYINSLSTINIHELASDAMNLLPGIYVYSVKMRSLLDGAENQRFQKFIKVN